MPAGSIQALRAVRVVHPFPSILDGLITGTLALVAGGTLLIATVLALAMTSIQFSIGAVNDLHDATSDARSRPFKPIPMGWVRPATVRGIAWVAALTGLTLSALVGIPVLLVALAGLLAGLVYDLRLKGTAWSWLPFALGIPLLPAYAWIGATGSMPTVFLVLLPLAAAGGAALAIANSLGDAASDRAAGVGSAALALGPTGARLAITMLQLLVVGGALATLPALGGRGTMVGVALLGGVLIGVGVVLSWIGGDRTGRWAWETQAVGLGVLAVGWLAAVGEGDLA